MSQAPLIALEGVGRAYLSGGESVYVLRDVNLTVNEGELIAIVGASGSGKSTLMNILGCLDRPTIGRYRVAGSDVQEMGPDALAELRREHFGFIFQRYHLLSDVSALSNVEMPAVYAGKSAQARRTRALALLDRLGLSHRTGYRPGALSGGQQQRVSIARALTNGGNVILADEPTGALDSQSGEAVLGILQELNRAGHTIILVTHDARVAAHASRIIEISDGVIVADRVNPQPMVAAGGEPQPRSASDDGREAATDQPVKGATRLLKSDAGTAWWQGGSRFLEAFRMAVVSMAAHRLRTFLTMLGIVIGIAAVVFVVALGEASQRQVQSNISSLGTNTIQIFPGKHFGDEDAATIRTLVAADAHALSQAPYVDSATPGVTASKSLRWRDVTVNATINGVGAQHFRVQGTTLAHGRFFDEKSVAGHALEAVIDPKTSETLFGTTTDPIGQIILADRVPLRVIGVTAPRRSSFGGAETLNIWIPYTTAMSRVVGQRHLQSITVRVDDAYSPAQAETQAVALMTQRHGRQDFFVFNADAIRQTIESTMSTLTLLIASIALISLIVGGIGVMNIMLVSVTERTSEIGVRMAVGARRSDIMQQFLIEAVVVCLIGGALGILLAVGLGALVRQVSGGAWDVQYSVVAMAVAVGCSTLIGVAFGFLPARSAARLNPVEALSRD